MASPGAAPAPAPAPARAWAPDAGAATLYMYLAGGVAFIAVRLARGASLRDVAFPDLIVVLIYAALLWFHLAPPGSASRCCARFALWVLSSSMNVGFASVLVGPPSFEAGIWCFVSASVLSALYILIFC